MYGAPLGTLHNITNAKSKLDANLDFVLYRENYNHDCDVIWLIILWYIGLSLRKGLVSSGPYVKVKNEEKMGEMVKFCIFLPKNWILPPISLV